MKTVLLYLLLIKKAKYVKEIVTWGAIISIVLMLLTTSIHIKSNSEKG